jgi:hypothetical protein
VTEVLASAATLRHPTGRFWDSDLDLECENLGITVDFRPVEPSSLEFERARPVVAAPPPIKRTPARPASTPPRRPPWRTYGRDPYLLRGFPQRGRWRISSLRPS